MLHRLRDYSVDGVNSVCSVQEYNPWGSRA